MLKQLSISSLLLLATVTATAQSGIFAGLEQLESPVHDHQQQVLDNPTMRYFANDSSLSQLGISGYSHPAATARIPQIGTGGRYFRIDAQSFQRLGKNDAVWGKAAYQNGRKYDVVWNETSDFLQLYPYVMADGRGGDMKYEQYELSGGYTLKLSRHHIGIQMGYRALSEYRDRDPRPDNTTADLYGRLGYGFDIGHYCLATSLLLGKYKQTNELSYYNELGAQKEFHLTGIGNDFTRFSGASNNTFYKGHNVGVSLDFMPQSAKGLSASFIYNYTKREKVMSDLNKLPLNDLYINNVKGEIAWTRDKYGIRFEGSFASRKGDDNIFGEPTGNLYPQIGTRHQYKGHEKSAFLSGYYRQPLGRHWVINASPKFGFSSMDSRHNESANKLNTKNIICGLKLKASWFDDNNRISATAVINHRSSIGHELTLNSYCDEALADILRHIDCYFAKGETQYTLGLKYDHRVWTNKALSIAFNYNHGTYILSDSDNTYTLRLSFTL